MLWPSERFKGPMKFEILPCFFADFFFAISTVSPLFLYYFPFPSLFPLPLFPFFLSPIPPFKLFPVLFFYFCPKPEFISLHSILTYYITLLFNNNTYFGNVYFVYYVFLPCNMFLYYVNYVYYVNCVLCIFTL